MLMVWSFVDGGSFDDQDVRRAPAPLTVPGGFVAGQGGAHGQGGFQAMDTAQEIHHQLHTLRGGITSSAPMQGTVTCTRTGPLPQQRQGGVVEGGSTWPAVLVQISTGRGRQQGQMPATIPIFFSSAITLLRMFTETLLSFTLEALPHRSSMDTPQRTLTTVTPLVRPQ
jgi:hypothetical protein